MSITPPPIASPVAARNGMGIAALVLGIIGVLFGLIPLTFFIAGTLGLLAFIFGLVGWSRARKGVATNKKTAAAGAILGLTAMALATWGMVITFTAASDAVKEIDQGIRELEGKSPAAHAAFNVSDCRVVPGKFVRARVEVTNTTGQHHNYDATIAVTNPDDPQDRYGSIEVLTDLGAGQSTTLDGFPNAEGNVNHPRVLVGPASCKVVRASQW